MNIFGQFIFSGILKDIRIECYCQFASLFNCVYYDVTRIHVQLYSEENDEVTKYHKKMPFRTVRVRTYA
jgi:hypothetical protein